ncbi:hypothetical protein PRIPAC_94866, partial [Pristionchus pacificus]
LHIISRMSNQPCGSKSIVDSILTRPSLNAPSILRRKRKIPMNEDVHSSPISKGYVETDKRIDYVRDLASKYTPNSLMQIRSCPIETMQSGIVIGRLRGKGANCDLTNISCRVDLCGRQFDTVQVLAWHMSYSHTDLSSTGSIASFCFVCGHQMSSAKGKVAHLLSKHRELFQQHHQQCLNQQQVVYAPNAPGAARLRENRLEAEMMLKHDQMGLEI